MQKQLQQGILLVVAWLTMGCAHAQTVPDREIFFAPLYAAITQAKELRADILAPGYFSDANQALKNLENYYGGKPKADRLLKDQVAVQQAITKAQQVAAESSKVLGSTVRAYDDAITAGAAQSQAEAWKKAEQRFAQAVTKLESNDLDAARSKAAEAEVLLRDVELLAIKSNVLSEVRGLMSQAQVAKVPDYAPKSFAMAQQQLMLADQHLTRSRYELDDPKRLAAQAVYEIKHAQYLSELIQRAQAKEGLKQQVAEAQWLALEPSVRELAAELNVPDVFDQGVVPVLQMVHNNVLQQQQQISALRSTVVDREQQIAQLKALVADLNAAISKVEAKLGSESQERQALIKRLSAQDRVRENITKIEGLFTAEEGRVYRQAQQLIMSLNAISFRSGKSAIEPASFPVLDKVGQALKLFPNAGLSVEGHTDSVGSDSTNTLLSQDRADAVREYLVSNFGVSIEKISSVGYGKSKPVANNETETGRARNRRIEIVMELDEAN